jgi:hypothetical protein
MNDHFDQAGFADSILDSYDDFEPYGFVTPQLRPAVIVPTRPVHERTRERVIEAELLNHCSMVGC